MPEYEDDNITQFDEFDELVIMDGKIKVFDPYEEDLIVDEEPHDEWISNNIDKLFHDWENFKDTLIYSNMGRYMNFGHFTEYLNWQINMPQYAWDLSIFYDEEDQEYSDFLLSISEEKLNIDDWRCKYHKDLENCASALWCSNYNVGTFEEFSAFMFEYS